MKNKPKSKVRRKTVSREELISQITDRLWATATQEQTFNINNMLLGTNFSTKKYLLIWK